MDITNKIVIVIIRGLCYLGIYNLLSYIPMQVFKESYILKGLCAYILLEIVMTIGKIKYL